MLIVESQKKLQERLKYWRQTGESVAFVPTMGNLHNGHLRLVETAKREATKTIVSIFVNPLQFAPGSDYDDYPRTYDDDIVLLEKLNVDLVFRPDVACIYPAGMEASTKVTVPGLSQILCGAHRPGHFEGVTTVVATLFNMVQPEFAIFGEKDYQQLVIIKKMVSDLQFPVKIIGVETVREDSGLAMSSRNNYLSTDEKKLASVLFQTLKFVVQHVSKQLQDNENASKNFHEIEQQALHKLSDAGFKPEYVQVIDSETLANAQTDSRHLRVLAAAWLGKARLIDNLPIR